MSPLEKFMHHHPTTFAVLVLVPVALLVAWLTGDFSPVEAIRHVKGF
jgi:hypothetical protein